MTPATLGLDFGTTNTVASRLDAAAAAAPVEFRHDGRALAAFRSALCFWDDWRDGVHHLAVEAGPWAIDQFIQAPDECRFIQSLKSFAASRLFEGTSVHDSFYRFEDLLRMFFERFRARAGGELDALPPRLVLGRPVEFVGSQPDGVLAMQRYARALDGFGFTELHYVYEPVAAAFFFARRLARDATVLVADFGGGTTDFSLMHFEVAKDGVRAKALGHGGVGIAGDRFDYRIIDRVISPRLGKGSSYQSLGKQLVVPTMCYTHFASWHLLSVMKATREFRDLKELVKWSLQPELLARFVDLIESDQGYGLYKAVSAAKERLSHDTATELHFAAEGLDIRAIVERRDFEAWIAEDLAAIETALDRTMREAAVTPAMVDRVFLTGGSSFVPAVRRLFETRFGATKIERGGEFVSIANGLALIGARPDLDRWTVKPPPAA